MFGRCWSGLLMPLFILGCLSCQALLAGHRADERSLGVDEVLCVLLEEAPPKVTRWSDLVAWLLLPSTYSAVRRRQASNLSALQCWWSRTWRGCPHERVRVLTAQSCQLCGDPGHGLGCSECGTHVCLSCHQLAEAGWPGGSGPRRALSGRTVSFRDKAEVATKMRDLASCLEPLHLGPLPQAVVALWGHAHAAQGGGAERFLLAAWM